jgi:hypothetical protein
MRLMEKAGVHDPINLFRWAILRGYVTVERSAAEYRDGAMRIADRTMLEKLTFDLDQARQRLLDASLEFNEATRKVSVGNGVDGMREREAPENRRQLAYEEYRRAQRRLDEFLLADARGLHPGKRNRKAGQPRL